MPLIILLVIAVVAGYLIAKSNASQKIDETAASAYNTTKTAVNKTVDRLRGRSSDE